MLIAPRSTFFLLFIFVIVSRKGSPQSILFLLFIFVIVSRKGSPCNPEPRLHRPQQLGVRTLRQPPRWVRQPQGSYLIEMFTSVFYSKTVKMVTDLELSWPWLVTMTNGFLDLISSFQLRCNSYFSSLRIFVMVTCKSKTEIFPCLKFHSVDWFQS